MHWWIGPREVYFVVVYASWVLVPGALIAWARVLLALASLRTVSPQFLPCTFIQSRH